MLQNSVTYGPARTDMDRCAEVTARTRTSGGSVLLAPEAKPARTGGPIPDYPPRGVPEIDSLARYYSCLGRLVPFLQEDLFASFRKVCQGFIIGEGRDCDYERIPGVLSSLESLLRSAGSGSCWGSPIS